MNIFTSVILTFSESVGVLLEKIAGKSNQYMTEDAVGTDNKSYGGFMKEDWEKVGNDLKLGIIEYGRTK